MQTLLEVLKNFMQNQGTDILEALLVLFAGMVVIKILSKFIRVIMQGTHVEGTMITFVNSIFNFIMFIVLGFMIAGTIKLNTGGFIAAVSACGLAIGLALQGSLSNFANGIVIIYTKPFREGDFVEIGGVSGKVRSIKLLTTELVSADNKKIIVTNTKVVTSEIINHSIRPTRRVDLTFSVAYGTEIEDVKKILEEVAFKHEKILKTPAPVIRMLSMAESALLFTFKVWVSNQDYWDVFYDITEDVYRQFMKENISIPFPQLDVHLDKRGNKDEE